MKTLFRQATEAAVETIADAAFKGVAKLYGFFPPVTDQDNDAKATVQPAQANQTPAAGQRGAAQSAAAAPAARRLRSKL